MFFNRVTHRWEKHPDCRCDGPYGGPKDVCVCRGLRPLDANGKPIDGTLVERLFHSTPTPAKKGAA